MLGSSHAPGLTPRIIIRLLDETCVKIYLQLSFLEIYNENIKDLLVDNDKTIHKVREDALNGMTISGLTEVEVSNEEEVAKILMEVERRRTTGKTKINEASSRSHLIITMNITSDSIGDITTSKLTLVDLAGSERAKIVENTGIRMIEEGNINKSLLSLKKCITALAVHNKTHIPYRDSKLTRILKPCFYGETKTIMIGMIDPTKKYYEDTMQTIKFANMAASILDPKRLVYSNKEIQRNEGKYIRNHS